MLLLAQAPAIAAGFPDQRVYLLSADMLDWAVDTHSALRADMHAMGVPPRGCYSALSSGMHGVLLATRLCDHVRSTRPDVTRRMLTLMLTDSDSDAD